MRFQGIWKKGDLCLHWRNCSTC